MFHKIKHVTALPDFKLCIQFRQGVTKIYDMMPLISMRDMFAVLKDKPDIFGTVEVEQATTASSGEMIWTFPAMNCGQRVSSCAGNTASPRHNGSLFTLHNIRFGILPLPSPAEAFYTAKPQKAAPAGKLAEAACLVIM